jgi:hypothetical protein
MTPGMTPMNDDHGDQFPGALPPRRPTPARTAGAPKRLVRMPAANPQKSRNHGGRPPGQALPGPAGASRFTRRTPARFDRCTLDVVHAGPPARPQADG